LVFENRPAPPPQRAAAGPGRQWTNRDQRNPWDCVDAELWQGQTFNAAAGRESQNGRRRNADVTCLCGQTNRLSFNVAAAARISAVLQVLSSLANRVECLDVPLRPRDFNSPIVQQLDIAINVTARGDLVQIVFRQGPLTIARARVVVSDVIHLNLPLPCYRFAARLFAAPCPYFTLS
jgi:hypothetical protein